METAKGTDLPDLLEHLGYSVRRVGSRYTVEGNSSDSCRQRSYSVGHYEVYGYGTPTY